MTNGMRNSNAAHIDFGFLRGVIPLNPKLLPSDLDMVIERKGQFFIAEWKRSGELMSDGQKRTLKELSYLPNFFVYIIEGYSDHEHRQVGEVCKMKSNTIESLGKGEDFLKDMIRAWYKYANSKTSSTFK